MTRRGIRNERYENYVAEIAEGENSKAGVAIKMQNMLSLGSHLNDDKKMMVLCTVEYYFRKWDKALFVDTPVNQSLGGIKECFSGDYEEAIKMLKEEINNPDKLDDEKNRRIYRILRIIRRMFSERVKNETRNDFDLISNIFGEEIVVRRKDLKKTADLLREESKEERKNTDEKLSLVIDKVEAMSRLLKTCVDLCVENSGAIRRNERNINDIKTNMSGISFKLMRIEKLLSSKMKETEEEEETTEVLVGGTGYSGIFGGRGREIGIVGQVF